MEVKFPDVTVKLVGQDGNAFVILGLTQKAMRRGGVPAEAIEEFVTEAMAGDYDHLLRTVMQTVNVE